MKKIVGRKASFFKKKYYFHNEQEKNNYGLKRSKENQAAENFC